MSGRDMTTDASDHCSRWSGIPQEKLTAADRAHIGLLCDAFRLGPWNIPVNWRRVDFGWPNQHTRFALCQPQIATFDNDRLTRLVVLAHDRLIRVEISPLSFRYIAVDMWSGRERTGGMAQRHPTMEDAVASLRA